MWPWPAEAEQPSCGPYGRSEHTPTHSERCVAGGRAESRSRGLSDRSWQGWGVRRSREGFLRAVMDEAAAPSDGLDGAAQPAQYISDAVLTRVSMH